MRENNCCKCVRERGTVPVECGCPCHQAAPNTELKKALVERISDPEIIRKAAGQGAQDQNDMLAAAPNTSKGDIREIFCRIAEEALEDVGPGGKGDELDRIMSALNTFLSQLAEEIESQNVELRDKEDHLPNAYQWLKGKNEARSEAAAIIRKYIR